MSETKSVPLNTVLKAVNSILTSLSEGNEIKVIFGGVPSTDGKTVYLGEPPQHSEEALEAYLSHGTHEIHHVLYSSFKNIESLGPLFMLVNVLEDVRIDAIGYHRAPGSFIWRESHLNKLAESDKLPKARKNTEPGALLCVTCFWTMTDLMLGYGIAKGYAKEAKELFIGKYGTKCFEEIHRLAEQAVRSPNTDSVISIAKEIAMKFYKAIKTSVSKEEGGHSAMECESSMCSDSSSEGSEISEAVKAVFSGVDLKDIDVHLAVEKSLKENRGKGSSSVSSGSGSFWPIVRSALSPRADELFEKDADALRTAGIQRFQRLLQGAGYRDSGLGRTGRDLENSRLSRVFVGDGRVFRREIACNQVSAAISILLDRSGSMDRKLMRTASLCAQALAELADSIRGCSSKVLAFPGTERQTLLEVKDFGERALSCLDRFCSLRPFGFTPVKQTINSAAAELSGRTEQRKIIFLITDGLCAEEDELQKIEKELLSAGIEIFCLGIGEDAPMIFARQKNIIRAEEMEESVYGLFTQISLDFRP